MVVTSASKNGNGASNTNTTPYKTLSRYLGFTSPEQEDWWHKTAPLLCKVLASARYNVHTIYRYLTFYYATCIPRMGPYPQQFPSSITRSGLPVEFSVNYTDRAQPVARIGFEPISYISGTARDFYNQNTAAEVLTGLAKIQSDFDPRLFNFFTHHLSINKAESDVLRGAAVKGSEMKSQSAFGFDLKNGDISVKGYVFPAMKAQVSNRSIGQLLSEAVKTLAETDELDCSKAFPSVNEYMEVCGGYNQFSFFSWDCVVPSESRLKIYGVHNDMTWSKIEEIWTMGGRADTASGSDVARGLELLKEMWSLVDMTEGDRGYVGRFDDGKDTETQTQNPMVWNYELRHKGTSAATKFYFPVHGENDMKIVRGLAEFFGRRGWTDLAESYVQTVCDFFPDRDLNKTERLISWISFAYSEKTGVYLSVYYHSSYDYPWFSETAAIQEEHAKEKTKTNGTASVENGT